MLLSALPVVAAAGEARSLQLAVTVNSIPLNQIAAFTLADDGSLLSTRSELTDIGVKVPGVGPASEVINLKQVAGLNYTYAEIAQTVDLRVSDQQRVEQHIDASKTDEVQLTPSSTGLVLNYSAFASGGYNDMPKNTQIEGGSLTLDGGAFSRFGVIRQSGILSSTSAAPTLRLDTGWSYSDEETLRTYHAGDFISSSLSWTRPVRMAGAQVQRNFALRPDLVTMPLPSFRGSAAVPSTVDIFIGNIKSYSTDVGTGPFSIDNVPVMTGRNDAHVVVTDVTGRKSEQSANFFTSPSLLRKGLFDYSVSTGFVRRNYGIRSFDYDYNPAIVVDLRYGLLDDFTTELHTEAVPGFASAGLGAYLPLGTDFGMVNGAVAASTSSHGSGFYVFAGWRGELGPFDLAASASRRFGQFEDLAAFTATPITITDQSLNWALPQEREQISVGYYQAALQASMHVTAIHTENELGKHSLFASADFSKQLGWDSTLFGNTYVSDSGTYGFGLGLTIPFNRKVQMSASTQYSNSHLSSVVEASRSLGDKPGSYGWRVSHGENTAAAFTSVSAAYKAAAMRVEFGGSQNGTSTGLYAQADGAVALADGDLFFGNTVNDSFAVVDAGLPGVPVLLENREIGTTGNNGKLLVPGLNAYQKNKLSLDVTRLPVTAVVTSTEMSVAPKDRAGVLADFGIRKNTSSAVVILSDAQGNLLAPGTSVTVESTKEEAVVGYDGRVFLTTLAAQNRIDTHGNIACSAEFAFVMKGDAQQVIGPVICQQAQTPQ